MHVVTNGAQVAAAAAVHDQRLVATTEQMPKQFVPAIEAAGGSAQKPLHPGDEVGEGSFEHQMKMVSHEAIGVDLPLGFGACLGKSLQKTATVGVVLKDWLTTVTAIDDV